MNNPIPQNRIPQIDVKPSDRLPISIARQQQIIDGTNAKLRANPRQGFCFMGKPGVGKTFLMRAIQSAVLKSHVPGCISKPVITKLCTLAEWQTARVRQVRGEAAPLADSISPERIRKIARENEMYSQALPSGAIFPFVTFHVFMDEFDSQPTVSEFSTSGLQMLVNAIYENAPRIVPGNDQDFCQLVVAMNKSWPEFEASYGTHVARRIAEMCVRVDFDREVSLIDPTPENPNLVPGDPVLEALFE